jgi:hypothetical protein
MSCRFLSLKDRSADIERRFGFPMSYTRLRAHFRRTGIKFQRTKVVMRASTKNLKSRARDRKLFSQELVSLMRAKAHIWILDECSTNLWSVPRLSKTWMLPEEQITRVINTQRRSGVTIYAAICNFTDDIQFMLAHGSNSVNYKLFLR